MDYIESLGLAKGDQVLLGDNFAPRWRGRLAMVTRPYRSGQLGSHFGIYIPAEQLGPDAKYGTNLTVDYRGVAVGLKNAPGMAIWGSLSRLCQECFSAEASVACPYCDYCADQIQTDARNEEYDRERLQAQMSADDMGPGFTATETDEGWRVVARNTCLEEDGPHSRWFVGRVFPAPNIPTDDFDGMLDDPFCD